MRIANAQSSRPAGGGRLFAFGLALGLALALAWPACAATVCNVRDHGARGDGKTLDTAAILACLGDQVPTVVLLPAPGRYLSAPFNLSSSTTLRVQSGATLLASDNASLWPVVADLPSYPRPVENDGNMTGRYAPFIGTDSHAHDVTIDGGGTIDGQGLAWWFRSGRLPGHAKTILHTRGRLIEPMYSARFTVRDISIRNSPFWTIHPYACDDVLIENVTISAPVWSRNTDGIDPDSSTNVVIRNCTLSGGDDNIAIKSGQDKAGRAFNRPTVNVTVDDVEILHGDGISIGSEMSGGVRNVSVRNVRVGLALHPLRIKSGYGRGGIVEHVSFDDVTLGGLANNIAITVNEYDGNIPANASRAPEGWPTIRNVSFTNIRGRALTAGVFTCIPEVPCEGIRLDHIDISSVRGFTNCTNVAGSVGGDVTPKACFE